MLLIFNFIDFSEKYFTGSFFGFSLSRSRGQSPPLLSAHAVVRLIFIYGNILVH